MKTSIKHNPNKERITVHRTTEGTIFEITILILAVIVWALIILMLSKAPDVVATHFDGRGHPNGYGSPWGLMVPCIITTVVGAGLLVVAYRPTPYQHAGGDEEPAAVRTGHPLDAHRSPAALAGHAGHSRHAVDLYQSVALVRYRHRRTALD